MSQNSLSHCIRFSSSYSCSNETGTKLKSANFLSIVVHRAADELGWIERCRAVRICITVCSCALCLLFHSLQVRSQFGFEGIETGRAALVTRSRACRVQAPRWHKWGSLIAVVNTFGVHCDVSKWEVEPGRARLFQVETQVLQITSLEAWIELNNNITVRTCESGNRKKEPAFNKCQG